MALRQTAVRASIVLAISVGVWLSIAGASPGRPAQDSTARKPAPPRVIQVAGGETVLSYDDYEGLLEVKAVGDRGGVHQAFFRFNGFYVRPILTLSKALQGQFGTLGGKTPGVDKYLDIYEIAPKSITASIHSAADRWCVADSSEIHESYSAVIAKAFVTPEPPPSETDPRDRFDIMSWMYKRTNDFERTGYEVSIRVHSRQAAGGAAFLQLHTHVMTSGQNTRAGRVPEARSGIGHMQFTTMDKPVKTSVDLGGFFWEPSHREIGKPFGIEDIGLVFDGSETVPTRFCAGGWTTKSDTSYHLTYHFRIAGKKKIEAVLEPTDGLEASWAPLPGQKRTFKLTMNEPGPEEIQAVRFTLLEASAHPGIATNAGNHILGVTCTDCGKRKTEVSGRSLTMSGYNGQIYSVNRAYFFYNDCPIDSLPDLFFRDQDNTGYEMGEGAVSEGLTYTMSPQIIKKTGLAKTETVTVIIKDGAASGRLQAEIMVGGLWYPAGAQGKTAAADGLSLMLPLDADHSGIHDDYESIYDVHNPDGDSESHRNGKFYGDGLTVFEEYRGVYVQGKHRRLSPLHKDLFVHDYSGEFTASLAEAARRYKNQGFDLWVIRQNEHLKDVINFKADHKAGDQYILVLMSTAQTPGLDMGGFGGVAFELGPPTSRANTIVIGGPPVLGTYSEWLAGTIAHEIGHNINCPHHGTGEAYRLLPGETKEYWVACLQGQHSGERDCFMTYNAARFFFNGRPVPSAGLDALVAQGKIVPYPDPWGTRQAFCSTDAGGGAAGNAASGAGDCLSHIKIKSY